MNPLNLLDEQLECPLIDNWWKNNMQKYYDELGRKKMAFLKEKFAEKGFGHLLEGMEKRRFSKIMIIHQDDWEYYYADNDTAEGAFIVATKDYSSSFDSTWESCKMTISFHWQDKLPLVDYIKGKI